MRRIELGRRIRLVRWSDINRTRCLHYRRGTFLAPVGPHMSSVGVPGAGIPMPGIASCRKPGRRRRWRWRA